MAEKTVPDGSSVVPLGSPQATCEEQVVQSENLWVGRNLLNWSCIAQVPPTLAQPLLTSMHGLIGSNHVPGHSISLQWPSLTQCPPARKNVVPGLAWSCPPLSALGTSCPSVYTVPNWFMDSSSKELLRLPVCQSWTDDYAKEFPTRRGNIVTNKNSAGSSGGCDKNGVGCTQPLKMRVCMSCACTAGAPPPPHHSCLTMPPVTTPLVNSAGLPLPLGIRPWTFMTWPLATSQPLLTAQCLLLLLLNKHCSKRSTAYM